MQNKLTITTLIFEDFELLDVFGPLEMFGLLNHLGWSVDLKFVSEGGESVKSSAGPISISDYSFSDNFSTDILIIPGGMGTRLQVENDILVSWLSKQCRETSIIASVCTGAALLAKTEFINDIPATTNKMAFGWVTSLNEKVNWKPKARWVESGNIYTSSGVSAGMDMALAIIENISDHETAMKIANGAEYEWHQDSSYDPFAKLYGLS